MPFSYDFCSCSAIDFLTTAKNPYKLTCRPASPAAAGYSSTAVELCGPSQSLMHTRRLRSHRSQPYDYPAQTSTSKQRKLLKMEEMRSLEPSQVSIRVCSRSSYSRLLATPRVVSSRRSHSSP